MHRLLLLRHSKAERSRPGERDRDRRLNDRGRDDAPRIGAYMAKHRLVPDRAVVSSAARTRETWQAVASSFRRTPPADFDDRIYEASAATLLEVIRETKPKVKTLLVVGHNPGLQELAGLLVATGDVETRQRLKENFATSALAVIEFALDGWNKLHPQAGRLAHFIDPREIAATTD
jgi:phosphohistidine phosphatase